MVKSFQLSIDAENALSCIRSHRRHAVRARVRHQALPVDQGARREHHERDEGRQEDHEQEAMNDHHVRCDTSHISQQKQIMMIHYDWLLVLLL